MGRRISVDRRRARLNTFSGSRVWFRYLGATIGPPAYPVRSTTSAFSQTVCRTEIPDPSGDDVYLAVLVGVHREIAIAGLIGGERDAQHDGRLAEVQAVGLTPASAPGENVLEGAVLPGYLLEAE